MPQFTTSRMNLATWCYLTLVLAYISFIMIASFYDTGVTRRSMSLFWNLSRLRPSFHNIRDITTNILLYMPLGFFVGASRACVPGRRLGSAPLLLAGFVLSFVVESIQAKVGRWSDIVDVMSNGMGYCCGYLVLYSAVKIYHFQPAALLGLQNDMRADSTQTLLALRFIYLLIAGLVALMPFDITVRFSTLLAKLSAQPLGGSPQIILDPLFHFRAPVFEFHEFLLQLLVFVPLAILSALILQRRGMRSSFAPALDCMIFALVMEAAKVFIRSAQSDVSVVIAAPLVGLLCGLAVNHFNDDTVQRNEVPAHADFRQRKMAFALLAYILFLILWSIAPYVFELRASALVGKLRESNFLPFALHFSARSVSSAIDIAREFLLYIPVGLLSFPLICDLINKRLRLILFLNLALITATALFVEMLQLLVVGRYVDLTDVLLAVLGGTTGILLQPKFLPRLRSEPFTRIVE